MLSSIEKSRNTAETPRATPRNAQSATINLLKAGVRAAVMTAKLAGPAALAASCNGNDAGVPRTPPAIGQSIAGLTIVDLNPPRAPLVLPLQNGVATRVSQIAGGGTSHNIGSTSRAVDFSDGTFSFDDRNGNHDERAFVLAPLSGTVHRNPGNCDSHSHVANNFCDNDGDGNLECCPGRCCNGGWGNTVELTDRGGQIYIAAHCSLFRDEAPEGAFILRGTPLCRIGSTGASSGPHLHFDKANPAVDGRYSSLGVPLYITTRVGQAEPSLIAPDEFNTCCNDCAIRPGAPNCAEYISFNRSLADTLRSFAEQVQQADPRIVQLDGSITPHRDASFEASPAIWAYQDVTMEIGGQRIQNKIWLAHTSPSGAGQRNPFIDTAYPVMWDFEGNAWVGYGWHTQIHTERFINYDLWDFANSSLSQQERDGLQDGHLPFTQNVQSFPDHYRDWELYGTQFQVHAEQIPVYLAVYRQMRGGRLAIWFRNGQWSEWTLM